METRPHRPTTGLIIGKFLPPHQGHLHLVKEALREVDELTILVCTLRSEPIDGALRHAWMQELVPQARVLHVTDEIPSYPHEHPDFWEIWTATIQRAFSGTPDIVFTSESYGDELALRLGARHICVDPERIAVPVSGTAIRSDPFAHWDMLPPCVRPWFVARVVLTGSECTGKTTLAGALAEHFGTVWSAEYGRTYIERKNAPFEESDVELVARGQLAEEDRAAREANRLLILDTDLISTAVYAKHYFGSVPGWIEEEIRKQRADLYLLMDIDVPWVPDGFQRDRASNREEMQELFREALRFYGRTWKEIAGTREERLAAAIAAITEIGVSQRPGETGVIPSMVQRWRCLVG